MSQPTRGTQQHERRTGAAATEEAGEARRGGDSGGADATIRRMARTGGEGLGAERERMEGAFGTDFGGVRVHRDGAADALGARAFTRGDDIHLARGEGGSELIGHELAHVVQQRQGRATVNQAKDGPVADVALEAEADAAGAAAARGERVPETSRGAPAGARSGDALQMKPKQGPIVHIGMNQYAHDEGKTLAEANADKGGVTSITDSKEPDKVKEGNTVYDLSTDEGVRGYVELLRLTPDLAGEVTELIKSQGADAKDEVAKIVKVYLQAQRGQRVMDRVVLSGHSVGSMIWGDGNGNINFTTFVTLAKLFPGAAGQVRDLMLSACYTGGEAKMDQYRQMFPNVQNVWAYAGSSPGTWTGAMNHMKIWERATENQPKTLDGPALARGTRKAENVASWSAENGYKGGQPISIWEAQSAVERGESSFQAHFSGQEEVSNPQAGPLRDYYNAIQRLLSHPELDSGRRPEMEKRRDVTIRLLFFHLIREKFAQTFSSQLKRGYDEVGGDRPDYAKLGRGAAMAAISGFGGRARGAGEGAREALRLLEGGLRDLDPSVIPHNWV